jgi:prepilin-type processing-associated H-X9-DG protein
VQSTRRNNSPAFFERPGPPQPGTFSGSNLQGDIYSFHTGGANIAFADGSVRFVQTSVSIVVLAGLVTKAGAEVIDSSSY